MSLLVLLKNRAAGQPVIADDDDNEFLNIINCLAGVSSDKSIRINSNDNTFAVARFNQTGNNDILELFADNGEVVRFEKTGKLVTTHTGVNTGFNADQVDSIEGANIAKLDTNLVKHKEIWFKQDPQNNAAPNDQTKVFIAPSGAGMRITKFSLFRRGGSHTAGQTITWQVVKNGAGIGSGVSFSDANNAANTEYSEALNTTLNAGDWVGISNTVLGGTAAEQDVSMIVEWEEKLV